jgi:hypothetical protein
VPRSEGAVQIGSGNGKAEQTVVPVDIAPAAAVIMLRYVTAPQQSRTHTSLIRPLPLLYSAQRESARAYAANGYSIMPPLCACSREGKRL